MDETGTPKTIQRGDIYWMGPKHRKGIVPSPTHPFVVIQDDLFNRSRITTVVVCALTTNLRKATEPGNVLLDAGEAGLPKQSTVIVSQIDSVLKTQLGKWVGRLSEERIEQILSGIRFQQFAVLGE
ncbi:MAG: type II toxin-antitoxin system PemK/MazF family toxin [Bdellovibrionales bacterium]|nr:type II toxin-antitoxin system PemK/MazF family toxin [Bdellovibrionales bacterium]